jgi:NMD protein affecting ribosome stability and mRNA decay
MEPIEFTCPRCGRPAAHRFYGPCDDCRGELRAAYAGLAREVDVAEYEPKLNVTPNAVALKEDD